METNLMKTNESYQTIEQIQKISEIFVQSGLFQGVESFAKAFVKVQAGNEIGIKPFAAMSGIHIIAGKPVIGAGIIASRIKASTKYDYKIREMNDKVCIIDFYQGAENIGTETFTIEDAKKAQTKNLDKYAKNMLFARAISNGVKFYCPDVFDGPVYVPEEMPEQTTVDVQHTDVEHPVDLMNEIPNCTTKKQLNALYKANKEFIDSSSYLKAAAKERQEQLKPVAETESVFTTELIENLKEKTPPLLLDPELNQDWQNAL